MASAKARDKAIDRMAGTLVGLLALFLLPIGTTLLGYFLSVLLQFYTSVPMSLLGLLVGAPAPIFAINYLVDGSHSYISMLYRRILEEAEYEVEQREENELKRLKIENKKLQEQYESKLLEEKESGFSLGSWKESA